MFGKDKALLYKTTIGPGDVLWMPFGMLSMEIVMSSSPLNLSLLVRNRGVYCSHASNYNPFCCDAIVHMLI